MTKDGKLSKQELDALLRAARILGKWCDKHEDYVDSENDEKDSLYRDASCASGEIYDFLYLIRGE